VKEALSAVRTVQDELATAAITEFHLAATVIH
jgi:hypothetical protein